MDFLKIIKHDEHLRYESSEGDGMYRLSSFLIDDIGFGEKSSFKKWVQGEANDEIATNAHRVKKIGDNIFVIFEFSRKAERLKVSKQSFIHILDEWEKVCKEKPQEVMITREGDQFFFEKKF